MPEQEQCNIAERHLSSEPSFDSADIEWRFNVPGGVLIQYVKFLPDGTAEIVCQFSQTMTSRIISTNTAAT